MARRRPQKPAAERSQLVHLRLAVAVDVAGVQVGGQLVDRRGWAGDAVRIGRRQGAHQAHTAQPVSPAEEWIINRDVDRDTLRMKRGS